MRSLSAVTVAVTRELVGTARRVRAARASERRHYEGELRRLADQDSLTGLLNRAALLRGLHAHLLEVPARKEPLGALVVLDLDHFKLVNDTLGHPAGDRLLVAVSDVLRARTRRTDTIARLGADEFAVLLRDADERDAEILARDLIQAIRAHARIPGQPRAITAVTPGR